MMHVNTMTDEFNDDEKRLGDVQLVVFDLDNRLFACEVDRVDEVIKHFDITRVPSTNDDSIVGVMNLRGKIIPIVDLKVKLGGESKTTADDKSTFFKKAVLVFTFSDAIFGLLVDSVKNIVISNLNEISQPPALGGQGLERSYISGITSYEETGEIMLILNAYKIVGSGDEKYDKIANYLSRVKERNAKKRKAIPAGAQEKDSPGRDENAQHATISSKEDKQHTPVPAPRNKPNERSKQVTEKHDEGEEHNMEVLHYESLNEFQLDILRELGNVGAGNAANALSSMLEDRKIMITVPEVKLVPIENVVDFLGGGEQPVAAVYLELTGDTNMEMLLVFSRDGAMRMSDFLMGGEEREFDDNVLYEPLDALDEAALQEVGNILSCHYLTALNELVNIMLIPSVPNVTYDMLGSIIDYCLIKLEQEATHALVMTTEFIEKDPTAIGRKIDGYFLILPRPEDMRKFSTFLKMPEEYL